MVHTSESGRYRREGYLSGIEVADTAETLRYRAAFDGLEARAGRAKAQIGLLDSHFEEPFLLEMATHARVLERVESLLGPDVLLLATHVFCKYGPEEKYVAWHQDATYWGLEPPEALTVWFAVDDSEVENGCMRVVPGSHRGGLREHGKANAAGNLLSINQEVPVSEEEERSAIDLVLRAGQISIHDGWLIHGSLPNRSARRRCGVTMRYVRPSVRPAALNSMGKQWRPVLVRGTDAFGNFGDTAALPLHRKGNA